MKIQIYQVTLDIDMLSDKISHTSSTSIIETPLRFWLRTGSQEPVLVVQGKLMDRGVRLSDLVDSAPLTWIAAHNIYHWIVWSRSIAVILLSAPLNNKYIN